MSRPLAKFAVLVAMLTVFCSVSLAQNFSLDYFPNLNKADGQKTVVNTGLLSDQQGPGNLCDMIYVFNHEQLLECCGCYVTPNGSRDWASVNAGFNANNLTGSPLPTIVVKQVTAPGFFVFNDCDAKTRTITPDGSVFCPEEVGQGPACDPRMGLEPKGALPVGSQGLVSWAVKTQIIGSQPVAITETPSTTATLSLAEFLDLQEDCTGVMDFGTGQGICTCGGFD